MGPLQLRIFCESLTTTLINDTDIWLIPRYPLSVINLWLLSLPAHSFALDLQCYPVLWLSPWWKSNLAEIWGVPQGLKVLEAPLTGKTHKPPSLAKPGKDTKMFTKKKKKKQLSQGLGDRNHHLPQLKRLTGAFLENAVKTGGRIEMISLLWWKTIISGHCLIIPGAFTNTAQDLLT